MRRIALAITLCLAFFITARPSLHAQERESALSEGEVEKLRDTAYFPPERVATFITFLDQRTAVIQKLTTGKRKPGREDDIHDQMEQFTSIADDLDDNLGDYSARHRDIRKMLPKLITAAEHWTATLNASPDHERYNVSRKLALEAVNDIREAATKVLEEQRSYFLAHPPSKEDDKPSGEDRARQKPF